LGGKNDGYPGGRTNIQKDAIDMTNNYPAAWDAGTWDTIERIVEE
jgi:hypothetical protein